MTFVSCSIFCFSDELVSILVSCWLCERSENTESLVNAGGCNSGDRIFRISKKNLVFVAKYFFSYFHTLSGSLECYAFVVSKNLIQKTIRFFLFLDK